MNGILNLLDMMNLIDRVGGLLYGLARHGQIGRSIRIAHTTDKDGKTPANRTGNHYAALLALYHIDVWSKRATGSHLVFNVRGGQWQWAVDLLTIYGAPVAHKARPWAMRRIGRMPAPWAVKGSEAPQ